MCHTFVINKKLYTIAAFKVKAQCVVIVNLLVELD